MANALYTLTIAGSIEPGRIESVFKAPNIDWFRINSAIWFVSTDLSARQIHELIKPIAGDANFVIMKSDPSDRYGWASKKFWEWLAERHPKRTRRAI
ncbi:hypothetical protein ILT44_23935 [Microvirga sp. BT689]|uniref:hypothetical protein n=1 Tax=Microvirga arvi TaxID=2778731 RepID=UPI0019529B92|nr:hypothetical protein [Microvirga arvi]MBM6583257.1 hypothetical protein [Microvirga arvi]